MTVEKFVEHYQQEFNLHEADFMGSSLAWLQQIRARSLKAFFEQGLPTLKAEAWKYTRLEWLQQHDYQIVDKPGAYLANESKGWTIVFVDGLMSPQHSELANLPSGVEIASLRDPKTLTRLHAQLTQQNPHPFAKLNTAFLQDGLYINIPENVILSQPIRCVFHFSEAFSGKMAHLRFYLQAGANSQFQISEEVTSRSSSHNLVTLFYQWDLQASAKVQHTKLMQEQENCAHFHVSTISLQEHAQLESTRAYLGHGWCREEIQSQLNGSHAHCQFHAATIGDKRRHVETRLQLDHHAANTTSRTLFKAVGEDKSRVVFNGKIYVHPRAQKTDAKLLSRNLLLSDNAEIDTKPELEIFADDIQCSHGATVGTLDADALFYMRSRGVSEQTARQFLLAGFLQEIVAPAYAQALAVPLQARINALTHAEVVHGA